jgi:TRAP transporter TAXI family solute receptor
VRRYASITALLIIWAGISWPAIAGEEFITIGTAGEQGVYYPAGGAICRLIKRGVKEHGIRCFVEATSGSIYNLKGLENGDLDLAFAQADWIYHAYKGINDFDQNGPDKSLRSVFSLHTEAFTVLARADSGINNIKGLEYKRIGIGSDGSGMRATANEVIEAEGWTKNSFAVMEELKPSELGKALCDNRLDAILVMTGHPNGGTQEITSRCKTHLVPVEGEEIDKLIHDNPYYVRVTLPGRLYAGSPSAINTFGVKATLVTTSEVDEETIYQVVKAVFNNLDNFKTLHPVFASLDKTKMVSEGLIAPLHAGALKYYREVGLIK